MTSVRLRDTWQPNFAAFLTQRWYRQNKNGEDFQRMYLQLAILQLFNLRVAILSLGFALNWNNS